MIHASWFAVARGLKIAETVGDVVGYHRPHERPAGGHGELL